MVYPSHTCRRAKSHDVCLVRLAQNHTTPALYRVRKITQRPLLYEEAAHAVAVFRFRQFGKHFIARFFRMRTAVRKGTALFGFERRLYFRIRYRFFSERAVEQELRIRMQFSRIQIGGPRFFDEDTAVHDADHIAKIRGGFQIVRDKQKT